MKILRCWCSNPTGGKLFAINLLFTTKQYKVVNFVYYGKTRVCDTQDTWNTFIFLLYTSRVFLQTQKSGKIGIIANFVFPYICRILPYLHHMMLINVKLDVGWYMRIAFQG